MNLTFQFAGKFILSPVSGKRRGYTRVRNSGPAANLLYIYIHVHVDFLIIL